MSVEIDRSGVGRWRYTCPHGHICWLHSDQSVWCPSCDRAAYLDGARYQTIVDQKTGAELQLEEVCLL